MYSIHQRWEHQRWKVWSGVWFSTHLHPEVGWSPGPDAVHRLSLTDMERAKYLPCTDGDSANPSSKELLLLGFRTVLTLPPHSWVEDLVPKVGQDWERRKHSESKYFVFSEINWCLKLLSLYWRCRAGLGVVLVIYHSSTLSVSFIMEPQYRLLIDLLSWKEIQSQCSCEFMHFLLGTQSWSHMVSTEWTETVAFISQFW